MISSTLGSMQYYAETDIRYIFGHKVPQPNAEHFIMSIIAVLSSPKNMLCIEPCGIGQRERACIFLRGGCRTRPART